RLQCYEGLDEGKALYEWKYAKQLLYTQLLRERIGQLIADADSLPEAVAKISGQDDAFFSHRFLAPRPLLQAIESVEPVVLLVDEIDKAEPEFEAFLLEVLSDFQVSVPELGTIRATQIPLVVLTSNNARELSDGLKRRCLHLFIDFPPADEELAIIRLKVPEVSERLAQTVVTAVQRIRGTRLHRRGPLHLGRARGIHQVLDLRGGALALLLHPPVAAGLLPRHDAGGRAAPAAPRRDDGGDLPPGTLLQGGPRSALQRGSGARAAPGGRRRRRHPRGGAARGRARGPPRLEARDDPPDRAGLV